MHIYVKGHYSYGIFNILYSPVRAHVIISDLCISCELVSGIIWPPFDGLTLYPCIGWHIVNCSPANNCAAMSIIFAVVLFAISVYHVHSLCVCVCVLVCGMCHTYRMWQEKNKIKYIYIYV